MRGKTVAIAVVLAQIKISHARCASGTGLLTQVVGIAEPYHSI